MCLPHPALGSGPGVRVPPSSPEGRAPRLQTLSKGVEDGGHDPVRC